MLRPSTFTQVDAISGADSIAVLSCSDVLQQRENPLALFTAALLFTHGGFDRDPISEFDARFPAASSDLRPFYIDLAKNHENFFSGVGTCPAPGKKTPVNWNKRLYCIDQRRQEECFNFLGGIAYSAPKANMFASTFSQTVSTPDPTSKTGQFLDVTVFGVMSNQFVVYLDSQLHAPAIVRKLSGAAFNMLPRGICAAGHAAGFTGIDPLEMRDE